MDPLRILVVGALTLPAVGCVGKQKHDALQRELDQTRSELTGQIDAREQRISGLEEALTAEELARAACDQEVADLKFQIETLEGRLAEVEGARDEAVAELAEALASKQNLRSSIDEMKAALLEASQRRRAAELRIAEFKRMLARFKPLIDAGTLEVRMVDGRMVLVLPTDVLFGSGRADLSDEGKSAVGEVGKALADFPDRRFQVEGHTDNVPINTKKYPSNWELASARALGVVRALLDAGMSPSSVSAASYGANRPAASNDTDAGKAKNRRIEIVIVPDLSGLPGFEELNELAKPQR